MCGIYTQGLEFHLLVIATICAEEKFFLGVDAAAALKLSHVWQLRSGAHSQSPLSLLLPLTTPALALAALWAWMERPAG